MAVVSNPASFSSLRSACSAEGYGSSTNFGAYYRGGSRVPANASAGISATAAGLQLSQFNGVTIPVGVVNHTSSVSPSSVSGSRTDTIAPASSGNATTNAAVVSIDSGGVGPYTYSWAYVSGDVHAVNSPNSNSTTFTTTDTATSPATVRNAVYRCTVTDTGNGNYQTTNDVNVQTSHLYDPA